MNRTFFITCGISALESGCWQDPKGDIQSVLNPDPAQSERQRYLNKQAILARHFTKDPTAGSLAGAFDQAAWESTGRLADLPAELATLRLLLEGLKTKGENAELSEEDKVYLIHSGNEEGLFCVNLLSILLRHIFPFIGINRIKEERFDPADFRQFGEGLKSIWGKVHDLLTELCRQRHASSVYFLLTGGYKAVVMMMAALCAVHVPKAITIAYLHETAPPDGLFTMHFHRTGDVPGRFVTGYGDQRSGYSRAFAEGINDL